jgi:hypothetical protein
VYSIAVALTSSWALLTIVLIICPQGAVHDPVTHLPWRDAVGHTTALKQPTACQVRAHGFIFSKIAVNLAITYHAYFNAVRIIAFKMQGTAKIYTHFL